MSNLELLNKKRGVIKKLATISITGALAKITWKRHAGKDVKKEAPTGQMTVAELLNCPKGKLIDFFKGCSDKERAALTKGINATFVSGEYKDKNNFKKFLEAIAEAMAPKAEKRNTMASINQIKQIIAEQLEYDLGDEFDRDFGDRPKAIQNGDDITFKLGKRTIKISISSSEFSAKEFLAQEPWTNKRGITLYPAIIQGKQRWVTIPE